MKLIRIFFLACLLLSCDSDRIYEKNLNLEERFWRADEPLVYDFEIEDVRLRYVQIQTWDIDSAIEYLVETVAVDHPTATVQFKRVSFDIREMHGPLKRHLPRRPTVVRDKVTEFLKEIGHSQDNEYWFEKGVNRVSNLLEDIGMDELTDDEGVRKIREVVGIYHRLGDNGARDALRSEIDNRQSLLLQRRQSSGSKRKLDEN